MKPLTTSTYTFSELIRGEYLYVDKTDSDILIFEFKFRGTAEAALKQIKDKDYALPYADDLRPVTLVGAAFSADTRNIEDWKIER